MRSKLVFLILALVVLAADQWSKAWATARLRPVGFIEVIPDFFRFSYATNRGVAFSFLADSARDPRWFLVAVSSLAAIFVFGYLLRAPATKLRLNMALSLLLAGILGNLIDRARLGEVVDFIELHWREVYSWPTFNIADSAICIGAVLLALEMLREERVARQRAEIVSEERVSS